MTTIIARASESSHWYAKDGRPMYSVQAKDGTQRPTTLRDGRKLGLLPSVTTILKVVAKPGLEVWKQEQMLLSALTLPRHQDESEKDFIARVVSDSKMTGKNAAERGTRIHESIEKWFSGNKNVEHKEIASAFEESVSKHFGSNIKWRTEVSFASEKGYGGKTDLYCEPGEGSLHGIVLDAKSKEFGPDDKVEAYVEHLMQLSAYRHGLGLHHAQCANVFASSTHPGLIKIVEWSKEELEKGWEMYQCILLFWKLKNSF
jgi:hypothetical protein